MTVAALLAAVFRRFSLAYKALNIPHSGEFLKVGFRCIGDLGKPTLFVTDQMSAFG
jgi:hypothetical protein